MTRSALLFLSAVAAVTGAQARSFDDMARVHRVDPQYRSVSVPRQECTSQWVHDAPRPVAQHHRNYGGLALGGVAGAVLGSQVGKGKGRSAATAVGAVVGALAGEHLANQAGWNGGYAQGGYAQGGYYEPQPQPREVRSCHTVHDTQNQLTGYRVEYEYRGQLYTTVTREHPGRTIPVRVSAQPVERHRFDRPYASYAY